MEKKKILFIDRDGTLIREPEDEQVDDLSKLSFVPGAIGALSRIVSETDYRLVMVTNQDGLGIFPLEVRRFPAGMKVPHMGWNTLSELRGPLFKGLPEEAWMYFVHSYYVPENDRAAACTCYGLRFAAALEHENFFGCQFHPEKSSVGGRRVLENFLSKNIEKYRREQ